MVELGFFIPYLCAALFTIFPSVVALPSVRGVDRRNHRDRGVLRVLENHGRSFSIPVLTASKLWCRCWALFVFVEANDRIGLTEYVIQAVKPYMNATMLPVIVFVTMSAVSFATGSNWGVIAIAMPVAFPLAQAYDVSIPLVIGALLSASGFGSHACFYSDSTVLSAQGAGCNTYQHAVTQLPYALIAAGDCCSGFLFFRR